MRSERPLVLVFCLSVLYFGATLFLASKKTFWNDELFTYYIGRRPAFHDVWAALQTGAEQTPPLFYLITRAFAQVFGWGYVGMRLPEILGFWILMISLYAFVSLRMAKIYGVIAMIFPLTTESFSYSLEARAYSLVLGFSAAALFFWQRASERRHRVLSLVGLGLCLAGAISCHYYAIFVFVPLGVGEMVRYAVRRKLDVPVAIAIAAGLLPLAVCAPLIRAASRYSGTFWAKPQWSNMIGFYDYLLAPAVLLFVCMPFFLALSKSAGKEVAVKPDVPRSAMPVWELAASIAFALIPIIAVFLAKTVTGAFTNRYALPAVIGIAILFAWSASVLESNLPKAALLLAGVALLSSLLTGVRLFRTNRGFTENIRAELNGLEKMRQNGTAEIVVADPHRFLEFSHLAGARGAPWLLYLTDRKLALRYTNTDDVESGVMHLADWAPLHVEPFREFAKDPVALTVDEGGGAFGWILSELTNRHWKMAISGRAGPVKVLTVSPPDR